MNPTTATLHFVLPEARQEFLLASRAGELASAISEADQHIRSFLKHGDVDNIQLALACLRETREILNSVNHIVEP